MKNVPNRFAHQEEAFNRFKDSSAIPIFFDPGLGKTRTVIDIACYKFCKGDINSVIIIAPNGVHAQWGKEEIPKWTTVPYEVWYRTDKKPPITWEQSTSLKFLCVNIDKFSTESSWQYYTEYAKRHKVFLVVDEATRIKTPTAKRTRNILYGFNTTQFARGTIVSTKPFTVARAVLTGTPITNKPFDVWAMFEFLSPGCTRRNWQSFQARYGMWRTMKNGARSFKVLLTADVWKAIKQCRSFEAAQAVFGVSYDTFTEIKKQDSYQGCYAHLDELKDWLYERAIFANIEDCFDMPERNYIQRKLDMSKEQAVAYNSMKNQFIATYGGAECDVTTQLACSLRLQQIASGFVVNDASNEDLEDPLNVAWFKDVPKITRLLSDLAEIKDNCIVICNFTAEAFKLYDILTKEGYSVCLQTGTRRVGTIDDFKQGKYQILLANIKIVSMGFNLQNVSHHILFYSNTYSYEDRRQTEGRVYRANQKNSCVFLDYIMNDTVDEKVANAQVSKKSLAEYIKDKEGTIL